MLVTSTGDHSARNFWGKCLRCRKKMDEVITTKDDRMRW